MIWLHADDCMRFCQFSKATLYRRARAGMFASNHVGRDLLIDSQSFAEFILKDDLWFWYLYAADFDTETPLHIDVAGIVADRLEEKGDARQKDLRTLIFWMS